MANSVTTQVLQDGVRNAVIKITGVLDTSDVSSTVVVDVSTLFLSPTTVRIDHIDYSIGDPLEVVLWWAATTPVAILPIAGRGRMSYASFGGLINNAGVGVTGDITLTTTNYDSGTRVFSIVLELVKTGVINEIS